MEIALQYLMTSAMSRDGAGVVSTWLLNIDARTRTVHDVNIDIFSSLQASETL